MVIKYFPARQFSVFATRMQEYSIFCSVNFFFCEKKKIEIENFPEFQRFELMFLMKMNEIIH